MSWCTCSYDPAYGARPLKRLIQRLIETRIAQQLLQGTLEEQDTVTVRSENNTLLFEIRSGATGEVKVLPANPSSSRAATPSTESAPAATADSPPVSSETEKTTGPLVEAPSAREF